MLFSAVRYGTVPYGNSIGTRDRGNISTRLTQRAVYSIISNFIHTNSIPMVSHIRIDVFSLEGEFLLGETHEISFGGEGLLAVAARFGYKAENFLCFRSKEQALDVSNMGAPLSSVCSIFRHDMGLKSPTRCKRQVTRLLWRRGGGVAQLWIRVHNTT